MEADKMNQKIKEHANTERSFKKEEIHEAENNN